MNGAGFMTGQALRPGRAQLGREIPPCASPPAWPAADLREARGLALETLWRCTGGVNVPMVEVVGQLNV